MNYQDENFVTSLFTSISNLEVLEGATGVENLNPESGTIGYYKCGTLGTKADLMLTGDYKGKRVFIQLENEMNHYTFAGKGCSDLIYLKDKGALASLFIICAPSFSQDNYEFFRAECERIWREEARNVAVIFVEYTPFSKNPNRFIFRFVHEITKSYAQPFSPIKLNKGVYTQVEVAEILGVKPSTISGYVLKGKLKVQKINGQTFEKEAGAHSVTKSSIEDLMQKTISKKGGLLPFIPMTPENSLIYMTQKELSSRLDNHRNVAKYFPAIGVTIINGSDASYVYLRDEVEAILADLAKDKAS